ncbi:MAG: GNAT family N-acetyltransferase [Oscillospiraceae bacterium]
MIRKATMKDLGKIENLYNHVLDYEKIHKFCGWEHGIYPTVITAINGIESNCMFIGEENDECFGSAILNQIQAHEYKNINWSYPASDDDILVIHTLCISPLFKKQGKGAEFLEFAEAYAKKLGLKYIRLDTHENNIPAFSLYTKCGYNYVETAPFTMLDGSSKNLKCLEKKL